MPEAPEPIPWRISTLRASALFLPTQPWTPSALWPDVVGSKDLTTTRRSDGPISEKGAFQNGTLEISQKLARVDFVWSRPTTDSELEALAEKGVELPNVGVFGQDEEGFLHGFRQFLQKAPPTPRLAFAPMIEHDITEVVEGYRILKGLLRLDIDPERVSDLMWRINRWRESEKVPGARINRIALWAVTEVRRVEIESDAAMALVQQRTLGRAIRVEMDVNLVAKEVIEPGTLIPVFNELVAHAKELSEKGDIP